LATARAAIRRGWVQPIMPAAPRPAARHSLGIWVVLPEPVSPAITTTGCARISSTMRSASAAIGRDGSIGAAGRLAARDSRRTTDSASARSNAACASASSGRPRQRDHSPCSRPRSRLRPRSIASRACRNAGDSGGRRDVVLAGGSLGFIDSFVSGQNVSTPLPARPLSLQATIRRRSPMAKTRSTAKPAKAAKTTKTTRPATVARPAASPGSGSTAPAIDIGIGDRDRKNIATGLAGFLADAHTLYRNTTMFHWNVTGPMFNALHVMFETQYTEQWTALDEIAERIRALGFNAPGSYAEFTRLTTIPEEPGLEDAADWREM